MKENEKLFLESNPDYFNMILKNYNYILDIKYIISINSIYF